MPGRQAYLDFAVKVGAELPSPAREIAAERARTARYAGTTSLAIASSTCRTWYAFGVSHRPYVSTLGMRYIVLIAQ
jgi:hypothetical protein